MKKGTIFLSGGGDIEQTLALDKKYFALLGNQTRILYIPLAMNMSTMVAESCYAWFSNFLAHHDDGSMEVDFSMMISPNDEIDISTFDSLYLGGGNTYKLLNYILNTNLGKNILTFISGGGIVYGGSAGAIILGKDIRTVDFENENNYPNYLGLNLVKDRSIFCHYSAEHDAKLLELSQSMRSDIIAIAENAGVIIDAHGDIKEVVGEAYYFSKSKSKL